MSDDVKYGTCVTHYACDCIQAKLAQAQAREAKMREALDVAVEALERFADSKNWEFAHVCDSWSGSPGDMFTGEVDSDDDRMAHEIARQALERIREMSEEA